MKFDTIDKIGDSVIQHGVSNDRVYLMKLDSANTNKILQYIHDLAVEKKYSKIFAKIPFAATGQ